MTNPSRLHANIMDDLNRLEQRIKALQDGSALARAHTDLEQRLDRVEAWCSDLERRIADVPEQAAAAMLAAIDQASA